MVPKDTRSDLRWCEELPAAEATVRLVTCDRIVADRSEIFKELRVWDDDTLSDMENLRNRFFLRRMAVMTDAKDSVF